MSNPENSGSAAPRKFKRPNVIRRNNGVQRDPPLRPTVSNGAAALLANVPGADDVGISRADAIRLGLPDRWLFCPKAGGLIADLFLPIKTPLSEAYDDLVEPIYRFHPQDVFRYVQMIKPGAEVKLWLNLTKTQRYYGRSKIVTSGCEYRHTPLEGHNEAPTEEQVQRFIETVREFVQKHEGEPVVVAVHCTHGFNRTGFLIASYLVEELGFDVESAINEFAGARQGGIYKADYLATLLDRFGGSELQAEPIRPSWEKCPDITYNYDLFAEAGPSSADNGFVARVPQFMDHFIENYVYVSDPEEGDYVRQKVRTYFQALAKRSERLRDHFPGSQPVSLTVNNKKELHIEPYAVSWKADGMRYLILINGRNEVYAFDRDNNAFRLPIFFPRWDDPQKHVKNTVIDCEVLSRRSRTTNHPFCSILVYDIIVYEGELIGKEMFPVRFKAIQDFICAPIIKYRTENPHYVVKRKEFWDMKSTHKIFESSFQNMLDHKVDGLIYQPVNAPYVPGRYNKLLKWKPVEESTVDFLLKFEKERDSVRYLANLYVLGLDIPYANLGTATKSLEPYNGKIVECTYNRQRQKFSIMRVRTDKSHPNAITTADSVMQTIRQPVTIANLIDFIRDQGYPGDIPLE